MARYPIVRMETAFQHIKVEIGGGENSGCGSEPSHAITRANHADKLTCGIFHLPVDTEANPDKSQGEIS